MFVCFIRVESYDLNIPVNSCQLITANQIYLVNPEEPGYKEVALQLYIYIKIQVWGMNTYLSYFLINSSLHVHNGPDVVKWQKVSINLRILTSIICEAYINHTSLLYHSPISSEGLEKRSMLNNKLFIS